MTHKYGDGRKPDLVRPADSLTFLLLLGTVVLGPLDGVMSIGGTLARTVGFAAATAGVFAVAWGMPIRRPTIHHAAVIALAAWASLSVLWTPDVDTTLSRAGTFVQVAVLVCLLWQFVNSRWRRDALLAGYLLGATTLLIAVGVAYADGVRLGIEHPDGRHVAFGLNANDLALSIALAIPIAWYLPLRTGSAVLRVLLVLYVPLACVAVLLTGSRGGTIAAIVGLVYVAWDACRQKGLGSFVIGTAAVLASFVLADYLVPEPLRNRVSTVAIQLTEDNIGKRLPVWNTGVDLLLNRPLTGVGAGAFAVATQQETGELVAAHNAFVGIAAELGLVGAALFAVCLVGFRAVLGLSREERLLWFATGLVWLAGVSSLSWEHRKVSWILIGLMLTTHRGRVLRKPSLQAFPPVLPRRRTARK